jgi:hypothetical protein
MGTDGGLFALFGFDFIKPVNPYRSEIFNCGVFVGRYGGVFIFLHPRCFYGLQIRF